MHYYQFNIKDYSFATIRMTLMEDLAFRRMLDLFYESEKPLPFELKRIAKLIGMVDYQEEIRDVLNEFWLETECGWVNSRANDEIEKYQAKADTARANGRKGGRPSKPRKTQLVNLANPEKSESKANHKPITNNHKPNIDTSSLKNDGFIFWWNTYPKKVAKPDALKAFKSASKNMSDDSFRNFVDELCYDAPKRYAETEKQFIPAPAKYIRQELYKDDRD